MRPWPSARRLGPGSRSRGRNAGAGGCRRLPHTRRWPAWPPPASGRSCGGRARSSGCRRSSPSARYRGNGSSLWLLPRYRLGPSAWEGDGMVELPRSLPEFEARFPDEAACTRWLLGKRWPGGFRCPACGHDEGWELGRERLTVQCAACERQVSVTAGTALHGSHLPLRTWFLAAWLVATHRNGMSARQLWLQLGLGC